MGREAGRAPIAGQASRPWLAVAVTVALTAGNDIGAVTVNANKSVTAYFTQITYTLTTATSGSGSVAKNPNAASYATGTQVVPTNRQAARP